MIVVGTLINLYREQHNLSLDDLSKASKVDRFVLHRMEQGKLASSKHVPALITFLFSQDPFYGKSKQSPNPSR